MRLLLASICFVAFAAHAQDPGTMAAINQQVQQQNMQAAQNAQMAAQNAQNAAMSSGEDGTAAPSFSVKSGTYPGTIRVELKSYSRHAKIYYTFGDWTPTDKSTLYAGPITVASSETISAIAVAPHLPASYVAKAVYQIAGNSAGAGALTPASGPVVLPRGMVIPLHFTAALDSTTASAGQTLALALSEPLIVDGHLIAPEGTPAQGTVLQARHARHFERPGVLDFRVDSLQLNGRTIPLTGEEMKRGNQVGLAKNVGLAVPIVGPAVLIQHGQEAHILPGAVLNATIASDTTVAPPAP